MKTEKDIDNLDLSFVKKKIINDKTIDIILINDVISMYKVFLFLKRKYPKAYIIPTQYVDIVWHTHILFTKRYIKDCLEIFGFYLHHPSSNHHSKR